VIVCRDRDAALRRFGVAQDEIGVCYSGRKGVFESPSLIRKRNQTNQLQTKLLTSGPGGRRFKSSLPDQSFQAVIANSAELFFVQQGATGNFGTTVGTWKPSPACSAVNLRNSTSSFTFE